MPTLYIFNKFRKWKETCRAQPSFHNDQPKEKTKNFQWTQPEFCLLAETIIDLKQKKVRDINQAASKIIGRSHQAIQKIRTKTEYKRVERSVKLESTTNSVEYPWQQDPNQITTTTDVEHSPSPTTCVDHSLQQTLELPVITDVQHSLTPFNCVEHSPHVTTHTTSSLTLPSTTTLNVE